MIRKTPEGELTRLRANLVCEQNLVQVAERLGLGEYILLGRGEEQAKGRTRPSILADVVEALIAAIYLDGGIAESSRFIHRFILTGDSMITAEQGMDYKTALQEYVQRRKDGELFYRVVGESGPDHDKVFEAEAVVNGQVVGQGNGHSKKEAEQMAARDAMKRFGL
jgi:ribonuclease-3